jgi:outer membrane protein
MNHRWKEVIQAAWVVWVAFFLFSIPSPRAGWAEAVGDSSQPPLTLAQCHRLAMERSEEIAYRTELIAEAEARFLTHLSGILPKISFISTDRWQDSSRTGIPAFTRSKLPERRFTISQPIFSGFKEFAALEGARSERLKNIWEKTQAERLLFGNVVDAFFLTLASRKEIEVLNEMREILRKRIEEIEERLRIGRSRLSEQLAVQAHLFRIESEWEEAQARSTIATQLLQFLTGLATIPDLEEPDIPSPTLEPLETYLSQARNRADVKAAEYAVETAQQALRAARAGFFPSVKTDGNYYIERSGPLEGVQWDVLLTINVPLFQGGGAVGASREAASQLRQAQIQLRRVRRLAEQEIRDAYANCQGALAKLRALTQAVEAAHESALIQMEEYRRNLVGNLEVLSALQELQEIRRDLIQTRCEAMRLWWRLKAACGDIPAP